MPKFRVSDRTQAIIREGENDYTGGLRVVMNTGGSYFLACCGMTGIEGFSNVAAAYMADWPTKAEYLACLYRTLYHKGHVFFVVTTYQRDSNNLCRALIELGAEEVTSFPNLYHGSNICHVFKFNVRNICGRYCNIYGEAYAEPPKDDSEVNPPVNIVGGFAKLPVKPAVK